MGNKLQDTMITKPSPFTQLLRVLFKPAVLGGIMGILAKLSDESSLANKLGINDLGTYFGLWIVLATILSVSSRTRRDAALSVTSFFLAMTTAYYIVYYVLFSYFPLGYFLGWLAIALFFVPLYAVLVWYAKQKGWMAAVGVAIPVGILLWEAYSLRFRIQFHLTQFFFDLAAAGTLFLLLSKERNHRLQIIVLTPIIMVLMEIINRLAPFIIGAL